jgi:hypothetical protein
MSMLGYILPENQIISLSFSFDMCMLAYVIPQKFRLLAYI